MKTVRENKHVVDKTNLNDSFLWIPPRRQKAATGATKDLSSFFAVPLGEMPKQRSEAQAFSWLMGTLAWLCPGPPSVQGTRGIRRKNFRSRSLLASWVRYRILAIG